MAEIKKAEIKVGGMACAGCSGAVEKALSKLDGVSSAKVDLAKKTAYVDYDPVKLTLQDLKKAVESAGYKVA
jgi:copper ion binding protein